MKKKLIVVLVLILSIAFFITLIAYDIYLSNQGFDKSARSSKEITIMFFIGVPAAICSNIFFKYKIKQK